MNTDTKALTAQQLEILQHALGVDKYARIRSGHSDYYRNHFCAGGSDETTCPRREVSS